MQIVRGLGYRIARGGGEVIVQADGSIDITPKGGEIVTVTGAMTVTGVLTGSGGFDGAIGNVTPNTGTFTAIVGTTGVFSGILSVDSTIDTTSTITGSIHTDGGLGVAKALWIGTTSRLVGAVTASSTLTVAGILSVDDTTEATSSITGSIHTDGGLGVAKNVIVDGRIGVGEETPQKNIHMSGTDDATLMFEVTGRSANNKVWALDAGWEQFVGRIYPDDYNFSNSVKWLTVTRTGMTVEEVELRGNIVQLYGHVKVEGGDFTINPNADMEFGGTPWASATSSATILHLGVPANWNSIFLGSSGTTLTIDSPTTFSTTSTLSMDNTNDTSSGVTGSIHTDGGLGIAKNLWVAVNATIEGTLGVTGTITASDDIILAATKRHYFDGGTHTYIVESSADVLDLVVGAVAALRVTPTRVVVDILTLARFAAQIQVSDGVAQLDFEFEAGTINASRNFRFGRDTDTGTGTLSTFWLVGDGSNTMAMALNHKTKALTIGGDFNHDGSAFGALGKAPQSQRAHIIDADGSLADITAKFNTLLANQEGFGFQAAA